MAVKPEVLFDEFLGFCKPYLEKQKSTELVQLLQKRFNDCSTEFKSSSDFSDLIEISTAKIESDGKHIFVHIRDFSKELKSHQKDSPGNRKRKREETQIDGRDTPSPKSFKGESTDPDSDDSVNKIIRKSGTQDNLYTKCIKSNLTKAAISKPEEEFCITIDDSDDDEELVTQPVAKETSAKQCKQMNGNVHELTTLANLSRPVVNLNDINRSETHSHSLKKDKLTTKCPLQSKNNKDSHIKARPSLSVVKKGSESKNTCGEKQEEVTPKSSLKSSERVTIVLLDNLDDNTKEIQKKEDDVNSTKFDKNQSKKPVDKTGSKNENLENGEVDLERTVDIEDKPEVKNHSKSDETQNHIESSSSTSPDCISADDKNNTPELDLDNNSDEKVDSCDLVSDGKSLDEKPDEELQIESENDDHEINTEISTTDLSGDEKDHTTESSQESDVNDEEKEGQSKNQCDVTMETETENEDDTEIKKTTSHKSPFKKDLVVALTDILVEHSSPSNVDTSQTGGIEGEVTTQDDSKKEDLPNGDMHDIANGYVDDEKPGTSTENSSSKQNDSGENCKEDEKEVKEKSKTGSKKQIARLEKLLEDLRNKIEELKEKELDLDDMDDECSPYILEEKYQQKFVKVWNKLCELKNAASTTGRPSEKSFKYSGTRYPEINRKIQKFVNKRKQFPDYFDVHEIITKVNHDKKIGLGTATIERLAREAFLDVGESLQKRRRQDLIFTSAGHIKVGERPTEDPALRDPELKKKLSDNRKLYKEKMDQVLSKYSEKQLNVDDEGEHESEVDQSDEEEGNEMDKNKVDVPELTTILEDRGSPVLEILDEKSLKKDKSIESQSKNSLLAALDGMNAEDIEIVGETDTFIIENDNAERMEDTEVSTATDCSIISEEKTSGDEGALGSPAMLIEIDEDDLYKPTENNFSACVTDDEQRDYGNVIEIVNLEDDSDKTSANLSEQSDYSEAECPVLYVAEKIDEPPIQEEVESTQIDEPPIEKGEVESTQIDEPPIEKEVVESTQIDKPPIEEEEVESSRRRPVRILTGDDDLFAMSGVEEMSDSDNEDNHDVGSAPDKSDSVICLPNIVHKERDGKISSVEKSNGAFEKDRIDSIYSNILSQGSISKVKNMLHLPKSSKSPTEMIEEEHISKTDEEKQQQISHGSGKNHSKNSTSSKAVILTPGLKDRARNILSLKGVKTHSKHSESSESKNSDGKINSSSHSMIKKSGESSTFTLNSGYSTKPCSISSMDKTTTSKSNDLTKIHSEDNTESSDSDSVMELCIDESSQESVDGGMANECRTKIDSKDSEKEGKSNSQNQNCSQNSSQSSRSGPFLKIIDVTSIGIDDYNSDSLETSVKNTACSSSGLVEYVTSSSTTKLNSGTSNSFSKLFSKTNKISDFLSRGVKRKKDDVKIPPDKKDRKHQRNSECFCVEDLSDTIEQDKGHDRSSTTKSGTKVKSKLSLSKKKVVSTSKDNDDTDDDEILILQEDTASSESADDSDVIVLSDSD